MTGAVLTALYFVTLLVYLPWGRMNAVAVALTAGGGLIFGLGLLLSVLLIAGCTADPTSLAAQPPGPQVGEQVFAVGYGRIAEIYLNPVDMGKLTTDGLRGLAKMDKTISVDR